LVIIAISAAGLCRPVRRIASLVPPPPDQLAPRAGTVSDSSQQMPAIARALMTDPEPLLLEEPSAGLAAGSFGV
jgi:ABC-type branched-subunit amino acid transport system ATPase component